MNKAQEIAALDAFVGQLPRASYLHQALTDARQMIVQEITADIVPDIAAHLACRHQEAAAMARQLDQMLRDLRQRREELSQMVAHIQLAQQTAKRVGSELFASYQRISAVAAAG